MDVNAIFAEHQALATEFIADAQSMIDAAAAALSDTSIYAYTPFDFEPIFWGLGSPNLQYNVPARPSNPNLDNLPTLATIPSTVPTLTATFTSTAPLPPTITPPTAPSASPPQPPTGPTLTQTIQLPSQPNFLALPSSTLPYPTLNVPAAPVITLPAFSGQAPANLVEINVTDYMNQLQASWTNYSQSLPTLVQANWRAWFQSLLADNPMIGTLMNVVNTYIVTGGGGIPAPIEQAIITRAQNKVYGEQQRAMGSVWGTVAKRGLFLASGALVAGLREARQIAAESTDKIISDTAIANLDLEQKNMQFMLGFGRELQANLLSASMETQKAVTAVNGQAIELTKLVLTGMIEINNILVRIYVAQWEGFKAAVEVYKAQIQAQEELIHLYEAQIKAELAKTEINKAVVEILQAVVGANVSLVNMYKAQIDAQVALLEIDRVKIQLFQAQVQGYVGQVEGYKATWEGFGYQVKANQAQADVYTAQTHGFTAAAEAFKVQVDAYVAQVQGYKAQVEAIGEINQQQLKAWTVKADGLLRAFGTEMQAYATEWTASVEQAKITTNVWSIANESIRAINNSQIAQDSERGREHLTQWEGQLRGALVAADGLTKLAAVVGSLAQSMFSGVTSFAGQLETSATS